MTITPPPTLRIRTPQDLVDTVPYLLGFHPQERLVLIGINDTTVTVTARTDIDAYFDMQQRASLLRAVRRSFATGTIAVIYTDTPPTSALVDVPLEHEANSAGLDLLAAVTICNGRCRVLITDPLDGGQSWVPVPATLTAIPAEATYAGLTAASSRESLTTMFDPTAVTAVSPRQLAHRQATADEKEVIAALIAAHRAAQNGAMPDRVGAATLAVALQELTVRDAMWIAIDNDKLRGIELWVNLARRLPPSHRTAPLFLAAWRSYRDGNGALAGIAAELALAAGPDYRAAEMLLVALAHGIDPRTLHRLAPIHYNPPACDDDAPSTGTQVDSE